MQDIVEFLNVTKKIKDTQVKLSTYSVGTEGNIDSLLNSLAYVAEAELELV